MNQIDEQRKAIDKVDSEITELLNKRFELVLRIKEFKKQSNLLVEDRTREEQIISNLEFGKLDEEFVRDLYSVIFRYSKTIQNGV